MGSRIRILLQRGTPAHCLNFVIPGQRHRGEDREILAQRRRVYEAARVKHPHRWSGTCRNGDRPEIVTLNPITSRHDQTNSEAKNAA